MNTTTPAPDPTAPAVTPTHEVAATPESLAIRQSSQVASEIKQNAAATTKPEIQNEEGVQETPIPFIEIDMSNTTTVFAQTLEQIRDKGVVAKLDMGNGIVWTINGSTIADEALKDINLSVAVGSENIPADLNGEVTKDSEYVEISLTHDGSFGFDATLTIHLDAGNTGQYGNLYYYNEKTRQMEFLCASVLDENNNVSFLFKHASDYVIVISDEAVTETDKVVSTKTQGVAEGKSSDTSVIAKSNQTPLVIVQVIGVIVVASITIASGIVIIVKRKSKDIFDQEEAELEDEEDDDEFDGFS